MNSIMLSKIFKFVWTSKLKLSKTSKKYSENATALYKIRKETQITCDFDPLSKIWSHIHFGCMENPEC